MLLVSGTATPGFTLMATAAENTLSFDQTRRFLGVATGTRHLASVLLMGRSPAKAFLFMAQGAGFHRIGNGVVAQRGKGNHAGAIRRIA